MWSSCLMIAVCAQPDSLSIYLASAEVLGALTQPTATNKCSKTSPSETSDGRDGSIPSFITLRPYAA
jgi:hypothetical protein